MTGGNVIIFGEVGNNFGAGMTGGMAFTYDKEVVRFVGLGVITVHKARKVPTFSTRMNVNSFQDHENAQALPSNRSSIAKQYTKHYQAIDPNLLFFSPNLLIFIHIYPYLPLFINFYPCLLFLSIFIHF